MPEYLFKTLLKKRLWQRYFPVNFVKFLRIPFLQYTACCEMGQHRDKKFFLEKCYFLLFGSFYYSLGGQKIDTLLLTYEQAVL